MGYLLLLFNVVKFYAGLLCTKTELLLFNLAPGFLFFRHFLLLTADFFFFFCDIKMFIIFPTDDINYIQEDMTVVWTRLFPILSIKKTTE